MRAGDLRHRVTIQSKSVTPNDLGEEVITWSSVAEVWAAVEPQYGTEDVDQGAREAFATHWVRIRRRTDITPVMRVVYGDKVMDITHIGDANKPGEMRLNCREVVGQ